VQRREQELLRLVQDRERALADADTALLGYQTALTRSDDLLHKSTRCVRRAC
jgi:hypothetical protein